ncbi:Imm53 family immunity protein [Saprospira grandis]|uniref:Imm53 family immunity protein n=1 Tax=Saprospira grandis TaxID=1008 RepID=UPI0022DD9B1B|nr:Imm53 family immunity protein [Saprospira grandis]WBM74063.1 immunity 53 family protein [Saprospira grandis]
MQNIEEFLSWIKKYKFKELKLATDAMAGWYIEAQSPVYQLPKVQEECYEQNRWHYCKQEHEACLIGYSVYRISELIDSFLATLDEEVSIPPSCIKALQSLDNWYAAHCDGDWEAAYGISLSLLNNSECLLRVDLVSTHLEGLEIVPPKTKGLVLTLHENQLQIQAPLHQIDEVFSYFLDKVLGAAGRNKFFSYEIFAPLKAYPKAYLSYEAEFLPNGYFKITALPNLEQSDFRLAYHKDLDLYSDYISAVEPSIEYHLGQVVKTRLTETNFGRSQIIVESL